MTFSRFPLVKNALYGVGVYLCSYAVVYAAYAGTVRQTLGRITVRGDYSRKTVVELLGDAAVPTWKGAGWFLYGANGVPVQIPDVSSFVSVNVLAASGSFAFAFLLVPVALFVAGGYWTYRNIDARVGQWKYAGVGMALGYVVVMVTGALVFSVPVKGLSAGPNLLRSVFAGLAIPVVSGAVGARLAA